MLEDNFFDDTLWGLFATTGNVGYYLFLQALAGENPLERERRENRD